MNLHCLVINADRRLFIAVNAAAHGRRSKALKPCTIALSFTLFSGFSVKVESGHYNKKNRERVANTLKQFVVTFFRE